MQTSAHRLLCQESNLRPTKPLSRCVALCITKFPQISEIEPYNSKKLSEFVYLQSRVFTVLNFNGYVYNPGPRIKIRYVVSMVSKVDKIIAILVKMML